MKRHEKIEQIIKHTKHINANMATLFSVLAFRNDREITKFHKEFLAIKEKY